MIWKVSLEIKYFCNCTLLLFIYIVLALLRDLLRFKIICVK